MTDFLFNEGALELPEGWEDRSVLALSFPAGSKKPEASFAITRDAAAAGQPTLAAYVDRQMVDLGRSLTRFDLVERAREMLDGEPAERLEFTWRSPDGATVRQRQTIVRLENGWALTLTCTTQESRFAQYQPAFEKLIRTFRFRK
jgi:hypothetical protein